VLEQAVQSDPGFAPAHAALGRAIRQSDDRLPAARLALDDELPEAHVMRGLLQQYAEFDVEAAGASFARAIELNPTCADAHQAMAAIWSIRGEQDWAHRCIVLAALLNGDTATAADQIRVMVARWDREGPPLDRLEQALAGDDPQAVVDAYWRYTLEFHEAWGDRRPDLSDQTAVSLVAPGRHDEALAALGRAVDGHTGWLPTFLGVDPWFDPLRADPRFAELLERVRPSGA
jgi:hypothetical protein